MPLTCGSLCRCSADRESLHRLSELPSGGPQSHPHSGEPDVHLGRDIFFPDDEEDAIPPGSFFFCFFFPFLQFSRSFARRLPLAAMLGAPKPAGCSAPGLLAAILAVALSGRGAAGQPCPTQCSCAGTAVDCHGQGLRGVPRNIPRNAERL